MNSKVTVYITVGIPASGKSTWVSRNLSKSALIVALDVIRNDVYGFFPQELDERKERIIWNRALDMAAEGILRGKDVLLDSMALTKEFRMKILNNLENRTGVSFKKVAIFFDTPLEVAVQRNSSRSKQVAEATIRKTFTFLEPPVTGMEFDDVITVSTVK